MIIEEHEQIRKQSILFVNREKGINGMYLEQEFLKVGRPSLTKLSRYLSGDSLLLYVSFIALFRQQGIT